MRKTVGLVALLISSAAVMVQPALARDRDDFVRYEAPRYTQVRRDNYRNNDRRDRHDYRQVDAHRDYDRR